MKRKQGYAPLLSLLINFLTVLCTTKRIHVLFLNPILRLCVTCDPAAIQFIIFELDKGYRMCMFNILPCRSIDVWIRSSNCSGFK